MRPTYAVLASVVVMLCVAACAGTPPPGEQAAASRPGKCERATGTLFCGGGDDQPYASQNSPNGSLPKANTTSGSFGH